MKYVMTIVFLFLLSGCASQPQTLKTPVSMLSNYELAQCAGSDGYLTDGQITKCRSEISHRIKNNTMTQKEWTDDQKEIQQAAAEVQKNERAAYAEYERQQQQSLSEMLQPPQQIYIHRSAY